MADAAFTDLTGRVIGAAIEVHRELGPGLLESVYEVCLEFELQQLGIPVKRQLPLPVEYKGVRLDAGFRIDLLVDDRLIVELKHVESLTSLHFAQTLTYMRLSRVTVGLLLNFNLEVISKGGIRRVSL